MLKLSISNEDIFIFFLVANSLNNHDAKIKTSSVYHACIVVGLKIFFEGSNRFRLCTLFSDIPCRMSINSSLRSSTDVDESVREGNSYVPLSNRL